MKNSSFSWEGCCRSLGNKTEVNQMKRVKDHTELLHDLLVLRPLSIWKSTPDEAVSRQPASQHICNLFPSPSVTFWANQGHRPASVSGCPTAGRPPCPDAPWRLTTPVARTYASHQCLQEGLVLRELQWAGFLPAAMGTPVQGHRGCEPPRTAHGAQARPGVRMKPCPSHLLHAGVGAEIP